MGFGPALSSLGRQSRPIAPGSQRGRSANPPPAAPSPPRRFPPLELKPGRPPRGGRGAGWGDEAPLPVPAGGAERWAGAGGAGRRAAGSAPGGTRADRAAVGARGPPPPGAARSLGARPPASPPPAPPPAPPLRGTRRGASRLQSPWRAAATHRRHCRVSGRPRPFAPARPRTSRSSLRRPSVLGGAAHGPAREPTSDAGAAGPRRSAGECGARGAGAARLGRGRTRGARGARTPGRRPAQGEWEPEQAAWMQGDREGETRGVPVLLASRLGPSVPRVPGDWFLCFGSFFGRQVSGFQTLSGLDFFPSGGVGGSLLPAASPCGRAGQRGRSAQRSWGTTWAGNRGGNTVSRKSAGRGSIRARVTLVTCLGIWLEWRRAGGISRGTGMPRMRETEATGQTVSSPFPQTPSVHGPDFSCYFLLF